MKQDIHWIQRFANYQKTFSQLKSAVGLYEQRELSNLEEQGLIQSFEYTHELAWKTLKDFLENKGVLNLYGSKDTTREAFKTGLIENGDTGMEMIISRNETSHTYNETQAAKIAESITNIYFEAFDKLHTTFLKLESEENQQS